MFNFLQNVKSNITQTDGPGARITYRRRRNCITYFNNSDTGSCHHVHSSQKQTNSTSGGSEFFAAQFQSGQFTIGN